MPFPTRVAPVDFSELTDAQKVRAEKMGHRGRPDSSNVMKTLLHFPEHVRAMSRMGQRTNDHNTLGPRLFQIVCMRTVWLLRCEYLWSRHRLSAIAKAGLTDADFLEVAVGPSSTKLAGLDRMAVRGVDELHFGEHRLSQETWLAFEKHHPEAPMDVITTYGVYVLMSGTTNSLGAVLEPDVPGYRPEIKALEDAAPAPG